jgi:hypothetical protein
MTIKKYNLTMRNFNQNIRDIILKSNGYNTIEEYEFETENPKFDLYIDIIKKHIMHIQTNVIDNINLECFNYMCIPLSYLNDDTKNYFYYKYFFFNGYSSFDEYFINYSYSLPCIFVKIPKKNTFNNEFNNEMNTVSHPVQYPNNEKTEPTSLQSQQLVKENTIQNQELIDIQPIDTKNKIFDDELFSIEPIIDFKNLYCKRSRNKLMVRAFNLELDHNIRPNDYRRNTWNIFNTTIKYSKHQKAWVFPIMYRKELLNSGVLFV